jgi:hypothetical protein
LDKMIRLGLYKKHYRSRTVPNIVRVVVTPKFMSLDFDDKKRFLGPIYGHYFDGCGDSDVIMLVDSKMGKKVGTYGKYGLNFD